MPCSEHNHQSWPKNGVHTLRIESCETRCGWCEYQTKAANNLRVHARRHTRNPKEPSLSRIDVEFGKAGRNRVSLRTRPVPTQDDNEFNVLYEPQEPLRSIQELGEALQRSQEENIRLRAMAVSNSETLRHFLNELGRVRAENETLRAGIRNDTSADNERQPDKQLGNSSPRPATSTVPNREYILNLADPTQPGAQSAAKDTARQTSAERARGAHWGNLLPAVQEADVQSNSHGSSSGDHSHSTAEHTAGGPRGEPAMPPQWLPAALLAQYPGLASIKWDQAPPDSSTGYEGYYSDEYNRASQRSPLLNTQASPVTGLGHFSLRDRTPQIPPSVPTTPQHHGANAVEVPRPTLPAPNDIVQRTLQRAQSARDEQSGTASESRNMSPFRDYSRFVPRNRSLHLSDAQTIAPRNAVLD